MSNIELTDNGWLLLGFIVMILLWFLFGD